MADFKMNEAFDQTVAAKYDSTNQKLSSISDCLHFLSQLILQGLPSDARIFCVGVGTGAEIVKLAHIFPGWQFTGIDISAPMIEECRRKLKEQNLFDRCELIHGNIFEMHQTKNFDAVLNLLVMHFVKDEEERIKMFESIASMLSPRGYLINAEISFDLASSEFENIVEHWKSMHKLAGASEEKVKSISETLRTHLAVLHPKLTEKMIQQSGFSAPIQFFQAFLIRGWYVQKNL